MSLRNICRCEFVKLSFFPGSNGYHLSNLDQKEKKSHFGIQQFFFKTALLASLGKSVNAREVECH